MKRSAGKKAIVFRAFLASNFDMRGNDGFIDEIKKVYLSLQRVILPFTRVDFYPVALGQAHLFSIFKGL